MFRTHVFKIKLTQCVLAAMYILGTIKGSTISITFSLSKVPIHGRG